MSALGLKVLIAGAGIAGPCLAYLLAKTHLDTSVTIVERSPSPRATGQSIDIRGAAIEIIKRMELEGAIRSGHTTEEGTSFVDSSGKTFAHFSASAGDSFTAECEILRGDLSRISLEATECLGNVRYVYGDSIQSLQQTDRNINVAFTGESKDTFDSVVAADGSTSKTRPMILDEQVLKDSRNFPGWYLARIKFESETRYLTLPPGLPLFLLTAPLLSRAACHHPMNHAHFVFYDHAIRKLPPTAAARSSKVWGGWAITLGPELLCVQQGLSILVGSLMGIKICVIMYKGFAAPTKLEAAVVPRRSE